MSERSEPLAAAVPAETSLHRQAVVPSDEPSRIGLSSAALRQLSDAVLSEIARGIMPGAVVMIGRRGRIGYCEAFGKQSPERETAMRTDSVFRIFSMTKPISSVGLMMLVEEGKLRIDQPVSDFIPAFGEVKVAQFSEAGVDLVAPRREITVQDLLRHTAGLSHEIVPSHVQAQYAEKSLWRRDRTNAEHADLVATLPLLCHPGEQWNYSRSVEILGRVIETVTGTSLGAFLHERLFGPLGMVDTGFHAPPHMGDRLAQPFKVDPRTGTRVSLFDMQERPRFEAGGGGLVSTAPDYARFAQMLLDEGSFAGRRYLGSRTLRYMTANHLPASITTAPDPLPPGYGFGLGFAVRTESGLAPFPGSVGSYFWNGSAGTQFWVDPAEGLWAIFMAQAPLQRERIRVLIRNLVYAALDD